VPRRVALGCTLLAAGIAGLMLQSPSASAAVGTKDGSGCTGTTSGDTIGAECTDSPPPPPPTPVGISNPVRACTWKAGVAVDGWGPDNYANISASGYAFVEYPDGSIGRQFPDGREERVFQRNCDGQDLGFTWVDITVTIDDVIDDAVDRARRQVPAPALDISPPPTAGGIVNLGLWLALQAPAPVTVRAEAGALWAEATATLASTRWDMGNGDVVECAGPGTPIVDLETVEQGPCGYTYRRSSPDETPYVLGITAIWRITYRSSSGGGTSAPMERTLTTSYDVDEIQTVGVSN